MARRIGRSPLCTKCGKKPPRPNNSWCVECTNNLRNNKPEYWRDSYLRRKYGISKAEYDLMAEEQEYVCKICGGNEVYRGLSNLIVDHDHATGKVRGLLCEKCNLMLGAARDTPAILRLAAEYLEGGDANVGQRDVK